MQQERDQMSVLAHELHEATAAQILLSETHAAHNYHPLPIVAASAQGAWITDVEGRRYLDCLAAYSAINFGHGNPEILAAAHRQLDAVTLVSRAFHHDQFGPFCAELAQLCGKDAVLPMNTGAEAVETAIKVARRWGYERKGVADNCAEIIVASGNFHGRTTTIVSFSDDPDSKAGYGPYTPGFTIVAFGDVAALREAIGPNTVAVLIEPVQGEAGVIPAPIEYLQAVRAMCSEHNVLLVADEIQSGLGRTGRTFACEHAEVVPDIYILGKALGGGVVPVSAVVANWDVLDVITPGTHGSTFGGNPLACAVGRVVVGMLAEGTPQRRSAELGSHLRERLDLLLGHGVTAVRTLGLWAGVDIDPALGTGREVCERLMARGILMKDTHGQTIRIAPPLVIELVDLDWAVDQIQEVLAELRVR